MPSATSVQRRPSDSDVFGACATAWLYTRCTAVATQSALLVSIAWLALPSSSPTCTADSNCVQRNQRQVQSRLPTTCTSTHPALESSCLTVIRHLVGSAGGLAWDRGVLGGHALGYWAAITHCSKLSTRHTQVWACTTQLLRLMAVVCDTSKSNFRGKCQAWSLKFQQRVMMLEKLPQNCCVTAGNETRCGARARGRHSVWSLHPAWNCWATCVWHRNRRTRSAPCARPQARVLCYWVWLLERTRPPTGTMFGKTASSRSRVRTDCSKTLHVVVTGSHLTFLCPVIPSRCR